MDKEYVYIVYMEYIFVHIQSICIYGVYIVYMYIWYIWNICIEWNTGSESVSLSVMSDSFVTPWTVACQAPLSFEFSRQEYWGRLPFPSPRELPDPGTEPRSPQLQADSSLSEQ